MAQGLKLGDRLLMADGNYATVALVSVGAYTGGVHAISTRKSSLLNAHGLVVAEYLFGH